MSEAANLTVRDTWHLMKVYFQAVFVCILVFGLPYALLLGTDFGIKTSFGEETASWVRKIITWGVLALVAYLVVTDLPSVLKQLGGMCTALGQAAEVTSFLKRVLWISFVIGYFFIFSLKYPVVGFWSFILVILPAAFTYDAYIKLLLKKESREAAAG